MESESFVENTDLEALKVVADHFNIHAELRSREFRDLCERSYKVHAGFLFYRDNIQTDKLAQICSEIYVILVRRIGATRENCILSGWKEVGFHLGLTSEEINYISNTKNFVCPTDTVLQVFTQRDDGTMGKIIDALLQLQRLDVIEGIFDPLNTLIDMLQDKFKNEQDQGYYSFNSVKEGETEILKPKFICNNLPEVLQWNFRQSLVNLKLKDSGNDKHNHQNSEFFEDKVNVNKHSILLTYSEDGLQAAQELSRKIQSFTINNERIQVICLENEKALVLTNPEQYIRDYFEEVEYVIPILTERYLTAIKSPAQVLGSSTQNVDCKYARFIYTLMSSHYINGTGCLNKKVRPILTQGINHNIISRLCMYPMLCVWTWENEFEDLLNSLFPSTIM